MIGVGFDVRMLVVFTFFYDSIDDFFFFNDFVFFENQNGRIDSKSTMKSKPDAPRGTETAQPPQDIGLAADSRSSHSNACAHIGQGAPGGNDSCLKENFIMA